MKLVEISANDARRRETWQVAAELGLGPVHQSVARFVLVADEAIIIRHHEAGRGGVESGFHLRVELGGVGCLQFAANFLGCVRNFSPFPWQLRHPIVEVTVRVLHHQIHEVRLHLDMGLDHGVEVVRHRAVCAGEFAFRHGMTDMAFLFVARAISS